MPWPMRFGPPPRTMIFLRDSSARPRTPRRRSSRDRRSGRRELAGAGVDALVDRPHVLARGAAPAPRPPLRAEAWPAAIGESLRLQEAHLDGRQALERPTRCTRLSASMISSICARNHGSIAVSSCNDLGRAHADPEGIGDVEDRAPARPRRSPGRSPRGRCCAREAVDAGLEARAALSETLSLNVPPDRHCLADRLHLRRQIRGSAAGNFSNAKRGIFTTT